MEINFLQAALIGILYYMTLCSPPWLTGIVHVSIRQPLVSGTIVGLILGDPQNGLIIGATINTVSECRRCNSKRSRHCRGCRNISGYSNRSHSGGRSYDCRILWSCRDHRMESAKHHQLRIRTHGGQCRRTGGYEKDLLCTICTCTDCNLLYLCGTGLRNPVFRNRCRYTGAGRLKGNADADSYRNRTDTAGDGYCDHPAAAVQPSEYYSAVYAGLRAFYLRQCANDCHRSCSLHYCIPVC